MPRKNILTLIISLAVCGLGVFGFSASAYAASGELSVTQITRITHPAFTMANSWQGEKSNGPWNRDFTRIMLNEGRGNANVNPKYPDAGYGRGFVWGYADTLKSLSGGRVYGGSLQEYKNNTFLIPHDKTYYMGQYYEEYQEVPMWSNIEGEENIVYALDQDRHMLVKYNVDTHIETDVLSYACTSPCTSEPTTDSYYYPQISGWTTDNNILIYWSLKRAWLGVWKINPITKTKVYYSTAVNYCSEEGEKWPFSGIHSGRSKDRKYAARYGLGSGNSGVYQKDYQTYCYPYSENPQEPTQYPDPNYSTPYVLTHVHWDVDNDWFLVGDVGSANNNSASPHLDTFHIVQVFFDRNTHQFRHNTIITMDGAGFFYSQTQPYGNYHGLPTPTMRSDGQQIMFMSTNDLAVNPNGGGIYSVEDYKFDSNNNPYGSRGMFLVDLAPANNPANPADINSDTHVNIKDIQACIKVITNSQTNQTIIDNCKNLVSDTPVNVMNIKDIQVIIQKIINS